MAPVLLEIAPLVVDSNGIGLVADLDTLVESAVCSCNAGDDNPY
ncbi:hypothetical protein LI90_159 [Carbonactinospora thermoautotrophica]|uniref:Uncharacterized protein n=1 Tax=Carbonactinospora thermoautotrophica TaxID=1469144 RepID=A0A132ML34_9ACTN|nr:hypothetical protein [Carbonactinospora thermoautotrophica]KWW98536.1 hypothetical protein LI90_159 [Carbonactinospora thermoautotrophica]